MIVLRRFFVAIAAIAIAFSTITHADTTYSSRPLYYTQAVDNAIPAGAYALWGGMQNMQVRFSFTLADPLGPNTFFHGITPLYFEFDDGRNPIITPSSPNLDSHLAIETDANGVPLTWFIRASTYTSGLFYQLHTRYNWSSNGNTFIEVLTSSSPSLFGTQIDSAMAQPLAGSAFWTIETVAAPIPEPETYVMLLAGLGLLGFVARRRKLKLAA